MCIEDFAFATEFVKRVLMVAKMKMELLTPCSSPNLLE